MRTYFITEVADWWQDTYDNLSGRFAAKRLVLPGAPPANRKWKTILRIGIAQGRQVWPIVRKIFEDRDEVLLVCTSAHYATLLAGRLARTFGRRPRIYLVNFYLHSLGNRRAVRRVLSWLLAQQAGVLVQSPNEIAFFQSVAPGLRLDYYPLGQGSLDEAVPDARPGDYIFAGGSTNRDYDLLIRVARQLAGMRFVVVRSAANLIAGPIPDNVQLLTDVPADEFKLLVGGAKLVVLPLKDNVGSSGQMVALTAMQSRKPVIYADFPVVSQYFVDGYSGLAYRPRDERDLEGKIVAAANQPELLARLGSQARAEWEQRFVRDRYEEALLAGVEQYVMTCAS